MTRKSYHHGNLEETLIEAGIEIINREGVEHFSIRKVAAACGVSHAAPYKHFADKDELLRAMQRHVSEKFASMLEDSWKKHQDEPGRMICLGQDYIRFFEKNPHYFRFFTTQYGGDVNLGQLDAAGGNRPFEVFRKAFLEEAREKGIPEHLHQKLLLAKWAMVHGIASLANMEGIQFDGDWSELAGELFKNMVWRE